MVLYLYYVYFCGFVFIGVIYDKLKIGKGIFIGFI